MKIDNKLIDCLNRYSIPVLPLGDNLRSIIQRSETVKDNVIPVLGMQGMGKSTLINGLLKANILPNDADETTCVPVEVTFGEKEYGEVIFNDRNKPKAIVHTREELNLYVDNNENPANKKGVERITLYRNADILKTGVTIVDLPGVGSVTLENERTTQRYIQNVATAIFVIPTVPTIRRMEEVFIQGAWAQFSNAMFVQNEWNDTKEEINDSIEHNTKILNQLAGKIGSKFNGPIIVVNAFDAVEGYLQDNKQLLQKSNIKELEDRITSISSNWKSQQYKNLRERVIYIIQSAINIANSKLKESQKSEEDQIREKKARFEKFKISAQEVLDKISSIENWLNNREPDIRKELNQIVAVTVGDIRADVYKQIDNGIVDGERLENTFNGIQSQHIQNLFDKVVEKLREFAIEFQSQMNELKGMLDVQNDFLFNPERHSTDESLKWEKGLSMGFDIAGIVVGPAIAALLFSNPVGWAAIAVGAVIAGVVIAIGRLFKKNIKAQRAREAKEKINAPIEKINENLKSKLSAKVDETFAQSRKALSDIRESQEEQIRTMRRESRMVEINNDIDILQQDLQYLNDVKTKFINNEQ